jgi:Gas vesicle synthesis protein GvpL/GvpF
MIWVYAICEQPALPPAAVAGLDDAPLEAIVEGPLMAVVSRHEQAPAEPALGPLLAHERVVEALMAQRAVLPLRFGSRCPDTGSLQAALVERRVALLGALDRVRGRVELAVRAMQPAAAVPAAASGREYLNAKLTGERSAAELHEPLAALAVEARRSPKPAPGELLRAAYLVEQPAVGRFRGAVERLQRGHPETALLCTGPWPAYSFVQPV